MTTNSDKEFRSLFAQRRHLLADLLSLNRELETSLNNNNLILFSEIIEKRGGLLVQILSLDDKLKSIETAINPNNLFENDAQDILTEIKLVQTNLFTSLSLKIQQLTTDYQNTARGLSTLKGYRKSGHQEQNTIDII